MTQESTSVDWVQARAERMAMQALLPAPLKAIVRPIRDHSLALSILGDIRERVYGIARARGEVHGQQTPIGGREHLLRAREHAILEELGRNPAYLGHLRSKVADMLRSGHNVRLDPELAKDPPVFHGTSYVVDGARLFVDSDTGLDTASMLEGEPEGWNHWLLDDYLRRGGLVEMDDEVSSMGPPTPVRALILGAGAGGLARAVRSRAYPGASFSIVEQDWVFSEKTRVDGVKSRNTPLTVKTDDNKPPRVKRFDLVSLVMPAPACPSAKDHRRRYEPDGLLMDPASVGPRRWFELLFGQFQLVCEHLDLKGLGYLLIPLGLRAADGYEKDTHSLEAVLFMLREAGLRVLAQHQLIERQPVNRPHVGKHRPERVSLIVQRGDV